MVPQTFHIELLDNVEFCDFLTTLDSCYTVPGKTLIAKEVQKFLIELKAKIGSFLAEANKVSICADVWSKKGTYHFIPQPIFLRKRPHTTLPNLTRESYVPDTILPKWQKISGFCSEFNC